MRRLKPKWTGTIDVAGAIRVTGRAYSATLQPPRLIIPVHRKCLGPVKERRRGVVKQAKHGLVCTECEKAVRTTSVGYATENERGRLVLLTAPELAALRPTPTEQVRAIPIRNNDPNLTALGTERRMYFLPDEDEANFDAYSAIWHYLFGRNLVGYIEELVITSEDASFHAILRPIMFPAEFNDGKRADLLVIERLVDPAVVRPPSSIGAHPSHLRVPPRYRQPRAQRLEPSSLLPPQAKRLARVIAAKS